MLRFIKHNFDTIDGVAIYPIVALLTFFAIFILMLFLVFKMKRKHIDEISKLPLEDDNNLNNENYE
jgi:cbb3-type cytochrome oxidase subunit 3